MAHGGIAILAIVFALALATFGIATAIAEVVVAIVQQHALEEESAGDLSFRIAGTTIFYAGVLQAAIAVAFVVAGLYLVARLTRGALRTCPECRSEVPRAASVCRYCTTELSGEA